MVKIIKNKKDKFTITNNTEIRDSNLSWKARGIFGYLWSQHDEWDFYETEVAKHAPDGRDSLRTGLKELEKFGYLKRTRQRDSKGVLRKTKWILSDKPMLENPMLEKSMQENPTLSNTNVSNTNRSNTKNKSGSSSSENNSGSSDDLNTLSEAVQQSFSMISPSYFMSISDYTEDLSVDLMLQGIKIAKQKDKGIKYLLGIYRKWVISNITTLKQYEYAEDKGKSSQGRKTTTSNSTKEKYKSQSELDKLNKKRMEEFEKRMENK